MSQTKYPIGVESFDRIIKENFIYIDKTEIIHRLIESGKYFFLSRPRRFGKSLMLSTIEAYFEGRRELFDGLWIDRATGVEWTPRPVFRLNFVDTESSLFGLQSTLEAHLGKWEQQYEIVDTKLNYSQRFSNVIAKAAQVSGQNVAVLIDEYDKVLLNTMHEPELHEQMKRILKPVFGVMKGADRYIHFGMITGVSRFSKLSIFSDLNNLEDVSLNPRYATLCGFTEDEIRQNLAAGITDFAHEMDTDFEGMMQILKDNYDGYHFACTSPDIYNPYSLIISLKNRRITHQWFESGTPTFLLERIFNSDEDIETLLSPLTSGGVLANMSLSDTDLTNMLYQTGYLTIKDYEPEDDVYTLGIPNREVEIGLYRSLLPLYTGKDPSVNEMILIKLRRAIRAGEIDKFMEILKSYLSGIPYSLANGKPEIYFENNLFLIFKMLSLDVQVETQTSEGRIDVLLRTSTHVYIMELKLNGTARDALRQIADKHYALPFATENRQVVRIGVSFSKATRTIEQWLVES